MTKFAGSADSFIALPNELVIRVLHFCSYEEILRFAATSKRYRDAILNSVSLQLHIELEANGLEIIKGTWKGNTTYSLLLDELVRYRDAWLHLQFERPTEKTLWKRARMSIWELREGIYGMAFSSTSEVSLGLDSLQMVPIDLADAPDSITFWSNFHDFTYDSEQELVVLLSTDPDDNSRFAIKLCSATTGFVHPLAQKPTLIVQIDFQVPSPEDETQAFITEIMDNIVVARVATLVGLRYEIMAWNWKSGLLLGRIGSSCGTADFSFLDKNHLALLSTEKDGEDLRLVTLSLYSLSPRTCDRMPTDSYFCASEYACARPILTFEFPELGYLFAVDPERLFLRSDPVPGRVAYTKSAGFFHPTALTLNTTLTLIRPGTALPDGDFAQYRIFIRAASLLRYIPEPPCEESTIVIPWATWGIQATRWFLYDRVINYWLYWSFGSRFISVGERPLSGLCDLSVLDFHPPTIRRHGICDLVNSPATHYTPEQKERLRNIVTEGTGLTVEHPWSLERSDLVGSLPPLIAESIGADMPTIVTRGFSAPVESRLPYRVVTRPEFVPQCEDWLIDGDHIIGTNPVHHGFDAFERITVYKLRT
ncbi:unnamed protein product [Rhizoctonia solani]|uniref:F-box domain-containing protein n=1 Tax=Rhizoctonia solani TaxID=456999 RepID=A0A8H3HH06_9AGAM|nr:unnamed protein product [Rhizoctonia solani]